MSALVASPVLMLSAGDHPEGGSGPGPADFTNAIAQSEQGLARFTNNPINFIKASDPPLTSIQPSSKYEILDDSKLAPAETPKTPKVRQELLFHESNLYVAMEYLSVMWLYVGETLHWATAPSPERGAAC